MKNSPAGATLLEIVMILTMLAVMATLFVPLASGLVDVQRANGEIDELKALYTAIVGDPTRNTYGYLGDVGGYPASLLDLVQKPGSNPPGWNGPYLQNTRIDTGVLYDQFGGAIEYFQNTPAASVKSPDQLVLISRGSDRGSTNTSSTPNQSASFTGKLPSDPTYGSSISNADNVVYPAFMDNTNLVNYQSLGTLNISINNYDENLTVSAFSPACPGVYDIIISSLTHPFSTAGHANEAWVNYAPGGASFDLLQGTYLVTVKIKGSSYTIWQEEVSVQPGTTQTRYLYLPGVDSATSGAIPPTLSTVVLSLVNNETVDVLQAIQYGVVLATGIAAPGMTAMPNVQPCARINIQDTTALAIIDSFIMPNFAYTKTYKTVPPNFPTMYTLTVTNTSVNTLAIYDNGILVGTVGMRGNKRVKQFSFPSGDTATIFDDRNVQIATRSMTIAQTYP
jgi:hypothetical protein